MESESSSKELNIKKQELLDQVPCGSMFPSCRFIKDAHNAKDLIQISDRRQAELSEQIKSLTENISSMQPDMVEDHIEKYEKLVDKKNALANKVASSKSKKI